MAGTYIVDTRSTFSSAFLLSAGAKTKFGSMEQDISQTGERKWSVEAAVTFHSNGMKAASEVISVTITGPATDPAASIAPGSPVEFEGFRIGFSAPERAGDRIRGGKPWFQASGVRPVNGQRPAAQPKGE
jgi:hypothetical protein